MSAIPFYDVRVPARFLPTGNYRGTRVLLFVYAYNKREAARAARKELGLKRLPSGSTVTWPGIPYCRCRRCRIARK